VTGEQLTLDCCDPTWTTPPVPSRRTPTPEDLKRVELADLLEQGVGLYRLRTATTIPAGRYL
jgi:hypothetical protein